MKNFKKLFLTVLIMGIVLVTVTGCGSSDDEHIDGELSELMDKINSDLPQEVQDRLMTIEINDDNYQQFFGGSSRGNVGIPIGGSSEEQTTTTPTTKVEFEEAIASENLIGSIAHSVILLRAKENADMEELKAQIKESIDPRKWICVWVEEEDVIIKNRGDLVIVIIVEDEDNRAAIEKGFDNL